MKPWLELLKLRITIASTVTTVVGYAMFRGMFDSPLALVAGGILLQACGAAALNQVQDANVDAKMERTASRPIPSGRISRSAALVYSLALLVVGGGFVKPVITGTVAKSSDDANRARAFSIFYMVVNIGSFTGKTIVAPMRIQIGIETVPFFSAGAAATCMA